MTYLGRATSPVLKRELKGTNTLTFQMPDSFFDSAVGDFVQNEFIEELYPERKIKLYYKKEWFEFFIKKIEEKKNGKAIIKSYTCTDAFIDELSRNGYGLTFDEELYNNVEEAGTFTEEILDGSLWSYHPEHNWGDFTEFKEEKLFRIPLSQFGGKISGYKLNFELAEKQREQLQIKTISNVYTNEKRNPELSDDAARGMFWDQQDWESPSLIVNPLDKDFIEDIANDGYIYIPYSCLNFCYGGAAPSSTDIIKYDRAATETALTVDGKLVLAPDSVDPRTIIQFLAIPSNAQIKLDEEGVIQNKDFHYFMTLRQWNEMISKNNPWYFFEDTRLVSAEALGYDDLSNASISHTYRYLYWGGDSVLDTYQESFGNKAVFYDGYLSDIDNINIILGKKFSIADRSEINISDEIDSFVTVYANGAAEYNQDELYLNEDWKFQSAYDSYYRVCSRTSTRQIIPQLARNLIQNGTNIKATDGWAPMRYVENSSITEFKVLSSSIGLRSIMTTEDSNDINGTVLYVSPPYKELAYEYAAQTTRAEYQKVYNISGSYYYKIENSNTFKLYKTAERWRKDKIYQDYQAVKGADGSIKTYKIYSDSTETISWIIDGRKTEVPIDESDYSLINFGIVGQEKKIEKDKIYCLGLSALFDTKNGLDDINFEICIGEGSIVAAGEYALSGDQIKIDNNIMKFTNFTFSGMTDMWEQITQDSYQLPISKSDIPKNYILFKSMGTIHNPYFVIRSKNKMVINSVELFEAYTKGYDCFPKNEAKFYRYSGRELFGTEQPKGYEDQDWIQKKGDGLLTIYYSQPFYSIYGENAIRGRILFEDMVMLGSTYTYEKYFVQRLRTLPPADRKEESKCYDTCGVKSFLDSKEKEDNQLPLDDSLYTEDNYVIETNYINMNKCEFYVQTNEADECDCCYDDAVKPTKTCYYQKFGYCPYRFKTEKHCRKIRTLKESKSNRFNLIQTLSKNFEFYPQFYINHKENGRVVKDGGDYDKQIFFITEKGIENQVGFRYGKNLKEISRTLESDNIVSKLYVQDVDSEYSKTGLCSIKTAEDNVSKDSYIIDFSYYTTKGILDEDQVLQDLYGISPVENPLDDSSVLPQGFLRQLGYYNEQYDKITNKIINLQDSSFTELEANLNVNLEGITTAQEQLMKIKSQMEKFNTLSMSENSSQSYQNYKTRYAEQEAILIQLIADTFFTGGAAAPATEGMYIKECGAKTPSSLNDPIIWFSCITDYSKMKEMWVDKHLYTAGILGQFNREYQQIQAWKKERASYLKLINRISTAFYQKYEPYLKEGTWTDNNFLTDNAYYFGALKVAAEGAIPKVSYNINVIALEVFPQYDGIYDLGLADITWVEDEGIFGINHKTGLPNRLKVLISEISYDLDNASKDSFKVQNYTTQFEDLFQQVTASVQSLTYNENIYKRASNFTSQQNIAKESLQGTLNTNQLTLLNTQEKNIELDNQGTKGSDINNHANKYKLNGQGLFFSNDGGQHWNVGVGPAGINADYIKVGVLDASKIKIVDGNYIYFSWDKNGIVAYRDPGGVNTTNTNALDFACFNKYGLSLSENGQIKLRAGYAFSGVDGKINTEKDPGAAIGFYLYNSKGTPIFITENSVGNDNDSSETARISLTGELFVTDYAGDNEVYVENYQYSKECGVSQIQQAIQGIKHTEPITVNDETDYEIVAQSKIIDTTESKYKLTPQEYRIYRNVRTGIYYGFDVIEQGRTYDNYYICPSANLAEYRTVYLEPNSTKTQSSGDYITDQLVSSSFFWIVTDNNVEHLYSVGQGENINYYAERESIGKTLTGATCIFINNKSLFKGEDDNPDKRRIICISNFNENEGYKNTLTVLKNGNLYIGGTIVEWGENQHTSIGDLSDTVSVKNHFIALEGQTLKIDVDNIYAYNGQSLTEYLWKWFKRKAKEAGLLPDSA